MECRLCLQSWWHHIVWSTDKLTLYMSLWNQSGSINIPALCLFDFFFFQIIWTALINFGLSFLILHCRQLHLMQIEHLFLFQSSLENSKTAWITDTCLWSAVCGHDCNLPKIFFYTISPIIFIHYFYTLKSINCSSSLFWQQTLFKRDCIKLQQRAPQIPT